MYDLYGMKLIDERQDQNVYDVFEKLAIMMKKTMNLA